MYAISPPRGKNPADKATYLLPKKAVYLSCKKKGSLPLLPKMAAYRKKKKKQEEEAEKEDEKKTKEEAEEEQKKWINNT